MRVTSKCIVWLVMTMVIVLLSWLIAFALDQYSGHHVKMDERELNRLYKRKTELWKDPLMYPGAKSENIFWFIQLSDIHISKYRNFRIVPDLEDFCSTYIPAIKPSLVLVTGDLTDAKDTYNLGSGQYEEEWVTYKKLIQKCKKDFNVTWLDIRGNHDGFNVPSHLNNKNLYKQYGSSFKSYGESGSYQYIVKKPFGKYAFNALDITPNPGPGRPFNFFGVAEEEDIAKMEEMTDKQKQFNQTVWFGHYPLSVTTTPTRLRNIVKNGVVYLCGHLHSLGDFVPRMYAKSSEGHLELESGDWKEYRRYRIVAIDHDIVSFVDTIYGNLPVILITNPKDARFLVPQREPYWRIKRSTHIRYLVFNPDKITKTRVVVDGKTLCTNTKTPNGLLYTCPWEPKDFRVGLHKMEIFVETDIPEYSQNQVMDEIDTCIIQDEKGRQGHTSIEFSLEETQPLLEFIPSFIMLADFCFLARLIYCLLFLSIVILPLIFRNERIVCELSCIMPQQILGFVGCDEVFWPLFYYSVYLAIGPFFVGEIIQGSIGVCFVHGIYTNGHWIPGSLTYIYGGVQLLCYNLPIMLYVGETIGSSRKYRGSTYSSIKLVIRKLRTIFFHMLFFFAILIQISFARSIWIAYGTISFLLCPIKTWSIPFAIYLFYRAYIFRNRTGGGCSRR